MLQDRFSAPGSTSPAFPTQGPIYGAELLGWMSDRIVDRLRGFISAAGLRPPYYLVVGFKEQDHFRGQDSLTVFQTLILG